MFRAYDQELGLSEPFSLNYYPIWNGETKPYWANLCKIEQFTGLTDKNGRRIFEGDIVKATYDYGPAGEAERIVVVVFGSFGTNLQDWIFKEDGYLPEIIGNIHDNNELLEAINA